MTQMMEAESQVKLDQYKQEHLDRQREAESRRAEPVSASALPATAGALAEVAAEVAAMQATIRGLRAELALRFDAAPGEGSHAEGTCAAGTLARKSAGACGVYARQSGACLVFL